MHLDFHLWRFDWAGAAGNRRRRDRPRGSGSKGLARDAMVMDHFFQMEADGAPEDPMLEGYTASDVQRDLALRTLVTGVIYRHPGLLVKTVTTLDVVSGGRA